MKRLDLDHFEIKFHWFQFDHSVARGQELRTDFLTTTVKPLANEMVISPTKTTN